MFEQVVDPAAVTRAHMLPLEGATDAIKFFDAAAARRRKLQADAMEASRDDQLKTAAALQQLALKNFGTGTALDQATIQLQNKELPRIAELAKTDPVKARFEASTLAAQLESMKQYGTTIRTSVEDAAKSLRQNNPYIDEAAITQKLLANTLSQVGPDGKIATNPDGTPVFNMAATGVNWGDINPNDAHTLYPYTSRQAVERAFPTFLDQRFPKGEQTIYKDPVTGQPFTTPDGRPIGKDIKLSPYQMFTNGGFQTTARPQMIEGDPLFNNLAAVGGVATRGAMDEIVKTKEQLGKVPLLPEEILHTLAADQTGQFALLHKMEDIQRNPKRYFGDKGDKIVKAMNDKQLMQFAGYDLVNTHAPKGGNSVKDNTKMADEIQQRQQQAFSNKIQLEHLKLARQSAERKAKEDPEGQSGLAFNTGIKGADGKPVVRHLTNKELKETNEAMESVPGMWFKALGGGGPEAQAEVIANLPAPISYGGSKWLPLSAGTSGKADYLTDPLTQETVQVFFDPIYAGGQGRIAVVPMVPEVDDNGKKTGKWNATFNSNYTGIQAKYFTRDQFNDFMHTYAPQAVKGGAIKYDRLAPFVNQAFKTKQ